MKNSIRLRFGALQLCALILLATVTSCSKEDEINPLENDTNNIEFSNDDYPVYETAEISAAQTTCSETSFPALDPGSTQPQSGTSPSVKNTIGTLDVRTNGGGYSNSGDYGKYEVRGGGTSSSPLRFNGTKPRVESFFKGISKGSDKKTILTGRFKIERLSDGKNDNRDRTCIIQSHATGTIVFGKGATKKARSAQFLLYAEASGSGFKLQIHHSDSPYIQGESSSGSRAVDVTSLSQTYNFNQEYTFRYETGYEAVTERQFSSIKIGGSATFTIQHTYTTESVYTRYGAYGTGDVDNSHPASGLISIVLFKDVQLCREDNS